MENPLENYCWDLDDVDAFHQKISEPPPLDQSSFEPDLLTSLPHDKNFELKESSEINDSIFSASNLISWHQYQMLMEARQVISTTATSNNLFGHNHANNFANPSFGCNLGNGAIIKSEFNEVPPITSMAQSDLAASSMKEEQEERKRITSSGRKKSIELELEEIQKHFNMPIIKAAEEMKVGLTGLKKRCRELSIMRWPHRKIKSLNSLINNVKELGLSEDTVMLEEHKRSIEKLPDLELTEKAKKLRQACFKANYKKRRNLAATCS